MAEKWTHLLQKEFAKQGEMEQAVGMETTLFGGPPELGNMLKLANGQIGFMTIFAHPLFANVADVIPAMGFAADEILTNKGVWFTRAEHEKMQQIIKKGTGFGDGGSVSPRSQSPVGHGRKPQDNSSYFPSSPLRQRAESPENSSARRGVDNRSGNTTPQDQSRRSTIQAAAGIPVAGNGNSSPSRALQAKSKEAPNGIHESMLGNSDKEGPINRQMGRESLVNHDLPGSTGSISLGDTSRDAGVSMRAGSTAVPVADNEKDAGVGGPSALGAFTFATSNKDEPVRKYDPDQHYPAIHNSARASAPMVASDLALDTKGAVQPVGHSESNTTSSNLRGGNDNDLTPTHSTEATSYMSDRSDDIARQQKRQDFEHQRNRATSAPMQVSGQNLRPSFSMSSTQSSQMSSKPDFDTRILNGDVGSEQSGGSPSRGRKSSTRTLGRKRSRIKMGLAFWKKKKDVDEEAEEEDLQGEREKNMSCT